MAPRRGGGGGGFSTGGGGGSSSDDSSSCTSGYPCSTEMIYLYGNRYLSLYTQSELYGQVILCGIWAIALAVLFLQVKKLKAKVLKLAMLLFLCSHIFLAVRYGLLLGDTIVPIGYRFESSVVVLLQRLGMPFVLLAVRQQLQTGKIARLLFGLGLAAYAILNIAYLVMDFIISSEALNDFKYNWWWRLSDRDFGLTYTAHEIAELLQADGGGGLSPDYIQSRAFDDGVYDYLYDRGAQIKIGVAADFVALALVVSIAAMAGMMWVRQRNNPMRGLAFTLLAVLGLLLSTIFRVVVATYFVLWNWGIVTDSQRWIDWISTYPVLSNAEIIPPSGFLAGYRVAIDGFPIVGALIEPLGILMAFAATVLLVRTNREVLDWKGAAKA